jgi:hypothetical protein
MDKALLDVSAAAAAVGGHVQCIAAAQGLRSSVEQLMAYPVALHALCGLLAAIARPGDSIPCASLGHRR